MTAIVFGGFLRGPDIILVHMDQIIAESAERMPGGRISHFGHRRKQRRRMLEDRGTRVRGEEACVGWTQRIGAGLEPLARPSAPESVAGGGGACVTGAGELNEVAALLHAV